MTSTPDPDTAASTGFDRAAAVTRSLLGYGVLAGPLYLVVGLVQAFTRTGFELSRHSLSLLANGAWGWAQVLNLVLAGLMTIAAAVGFLRAQRPVRTIGGLIGVYGLCLVVSGVFRADPMDGFPPGTPDGPAQTATASGVAHLAAGGLGFLALAAGFVALGRWFARRGTPGLARGSWISAAVVVLGFAIGAATATTPAGVPLLWIAVVAGWAWLAVASVAVYRTVPHPDAHRRAEDQARA